ncbi:MAG: tetratricopeptide repeat protein [Candidatus Nitrohelix vancouverensis]|uniref:Tetratricopeptide repeat protein n=1 Tax=Candidatus Nitrohelix vancouverensis TaxID=2705534 RepID=A0A7T0G2T7_9BACT|nr:MAG: tetratricopeptide repeat protein [Candidatus Nitrohelix vancouverensis]
MTESMIADLEKKLEESLSGSDRYEQFKAHTALGQAHQSGRNFSSALNSFRKANQIIEDYGNNSEDQLIALANLGSVYWEMAQLKKSMDLLEMGLLLTNNMANVSLRSQFLAMIGISYWRQLDWNTAFLKFERARRNCPDKNLDAMREGLQLFQGSWGRGVDTLNNRLQMSRNRGDKEKVLLAGFSLLPLLLFTGKKNEIAPLLTEIQPLAESFSKADILEAIPRFQKLMGIS